MKIAVYTNHLRGQILYRSLNPSKKNGVIDFEIFDDFQERKKTKLSAAFPRWCQNAVKIPNTFETDVPIESIKQNLDPRLFENLTSLGFSQLFPVQNAIIPELTPFFRRVRTSVQNLTS